MYKNDSNSCKISFIKSINTFSSPLIFSFVAMSDLSKIPDKELVCLAMNDNQKAFEELMNRHYPSAYFIVLKLLNNKKTEAEDLTIEAFTKAFNKLHLYKPDLAKFNTWFVTIVINHTTDYLRKKRIQTTSLDKNIEMQDGSSFSSTAKSPELNPEELVVKEQNGENVRLAISKLPKLYREIVLLRYFDDKSYAEIEEEVGLSINTLKTRMHRAKKLLAIILEKQP